MASNHVLIVEQLRNTVLEGWLKDVEVPTTQSAAGVLIPHILVTSHLCVRMTHMSVSTRRPVPLIRSIAPESQH